MGKTLFILLFVFLGICGSLSAQELNARVTVNSDKIQGTNKQVYETLQKALTEFINTKKWTGATFAVNERIDCSFTIILNEVPEENSYKGEIQVQARRPVYNSSYTTTLLNFRDQQFDFEYLQPVVNYPPDFLLYFNIKTVINLDNKRVMRCFNLSIQVTMPFDIFVY